MHDVHPGPTQALRKDDPPDHRIRPALVQRAAERLQPIARRPNVIIGKHDDITMGVRDAGVSGACLALRRFVKTTNLHARKRRLFDDGLGVVC